MFDFALSPHSPGGRRCDGASRRDFLRVGGLGALSLPALLSMQSRSKAAPGAARAQSVILIFLGGGLSHHDSFDPKPEAPSEIRGKYSAIPTSVPGVRFSERMALTAKEMHRVSLVRSGSHTNDHHETATNWALSGRFGSPFGDYPAVGAVAAHEFGFKGALPPYVAVPNNPSFTWELGKSAFLGGRYESFKAGDPGRENYQVPDLSSGIPTLVRERRQTLLEAVDTLAKRVEGNDAIATYDEFKGRAQAMVLSSQARKAFAIADEPKELRERYGRTTFGQSCLLARRLVESGVRFVTVNFGGWDHHGKIFEALDKKLPELDKGLSALIGDMADRGTDSETMVAVFGEFGRGPKLNKDAGRDHWGQAGSLLFFGGGVKKGFVLGKTDKHGSAPTQRPVSPADVSFTILDQLGIDPRKTLTMPDGRPLEVLDGGERVAELFA